MEFQPGHIFKAENLNRNDEIEEKDLDNKCSSSSDESQDIAFFDCLHEKEG